MTLKQANALIAKWKPLLNLADWQVNARFVNAVDAGNRVGSCGTVDGRQIADITIAFPHPPDEDIEDTIVHELLHCYFKIPQDCALSYAGVRAEQGINVVAGLLVRQHRLLTEKPKRKRGTQVNELLRLAPCRATSGRKRCAISGLFFSGRFAGAAGVGLREQGRG